MRKLLSHNAGIILGIFWLMWHFPLFFIEGSYQQEVIGFNTLRFWFAFVPGIICLQILQVWIYNNTNRSTLSAVLIHFMTNFSGEMLNLSVRQEYFRSMWTVVFTVIIVIVWGHKSLTGNNNVPDFKKIVESAGHFPIENPGLNSLEKYVVEFVKKYIKY